MSDDRTLLWILNAVNDLVDINYRWVFRDVAIYLIFIFFTQIYLLEYSRIARFKSPPMAIQSSRISVISLLRIYFLKGLSSLKMVIDSKPVLKFGRQCLNPAVELFVVYL